MREITKPAPLADLVFATYQGLFCLLVRLLICISLAHIVIVTDANTITIGPGSCGTDASAILVGTGTAVLVTGTAAASVASTAPTAAAGMAGAPFKRNNETMILDAEVSSENATVVKDPARFVVGGKWSCGV